MRFTPFVGFGSLTFVLVAAAFGANEACNLPQELRSEIAIKYPATKLVNLADLDLGDREFFHKDHGSACPGLTKVDFYGDGKQTFALALITETGAKKKAKLVLAHHVGGRWETKVLDMADGAPVPVVWRQPPGEYRSVDGRKQIRATTPVVVFAAYESWTILSSWNGKAVTKIWLRD